MYLPTHGQKQRMCAWLLLEIFILIPLNLPRIVAHFLLPSIPPDISKTVPHDCVENVSPGQAPCLPGLLQLEDSG